MTQALNALKIKQIESTLDSIPYSKNHQTAYQLALMVFDTNTFDPFNPLPYDCLCNEPDKYSSIKEFTPGYYYGYSDAKYSPHNSNRVFKLNIRCFEGLNPVIAVRDDCNCQKYNQLQAGLKPYYDKSIQWRYPEWEFYMIDPTTADGNDAVFTNQLEKEFAVEIAHLWEDGTLHRIYHLYY